MPTRHLLSTDDLELEEITAILARAASLLSPDGLHSRSTATLLDRRFVLAFFEPSTRTRISFESAIYRTGATCVHFTEAGSSVEKGESLRETIRTIESMGFDGIIMRHAENGIHGRLAALTSMSVISAGEGTRSHPTQALLDASTIHEVFSRWDGVRVAIVGDLRHSRVARSTSRLLSRLGCDVAWCAPAHLAPDDTSSMPTMFGSAEQAIQWADVVYMLRIQRERIMEDVVPNIDEYRRAYSISREMVEQHPHVRIMHPGPVNVGVELDEDVLDLSQCLIHRQVTHGVAVRMAVLEHSCHEVYF